jgi:uncharacterized protein (TIGR03086 family)
MTGRFLLQGALAYALDIVGGLAPESMANPTPCPGWDVRSLLGHLVESVAVLCDGIAAGEFANETRPVTRTDPTAAFSVAACDLLTRLSTPSEHQILTVGHAAVPAELATAAGAVEVAVHGWDLATAAGRPRRIPRLIAAPMLELSSQVVPSAARPGLFAAQVPVSPRAEPGERLVAFLGRAPSMNAHEGAHRVIA